MFFNLYLLKILKSPQFIFCYLYVWFYLFQVEESASPLKGANKGKKVKIDKRKAPSGAASLKGETVDDARNSRITRGLIAQQRQSATREPSPHSLSSTVSRVVRAYVFNINEQYKSGKNITIFIEDAENLII